MSLERLLRPELKTIISTNTKLCYELQREPSTKTFNLPHSQARLSEQNRLQFTPLEERHISVMNNL